MLVLIASLGRAPGVITGTMDALIEQGKKPGRVYLATTSDQLIWDGCIPLIREEFHKHYPNVELRTEEACIKSDDIYDEEDNAEFMRKVAAIMHKEIIASGNEVYLSLAGGRKTMSAAMVLLGQLYGVKSVLHLLVDPELESKGMIKRLAELPEEEKRLVLHPPAESRRLIEFPVFAIPWKIDQVILALDRGSSEDPHLDKIVRGMSDRTRKLLKSILVEAERAARR